MILKVHRGAAGTVSALVVFLVVWVLCRRFAPHPPYYLDHEVVLTQLETLRDLHEHWYREGIHKWICGQIMVRDSMNLANWLYTDGPYDPAVNKKEYNIKHYAEPEHRE